MSDTIKLKPTIQVDDRQHAQDIITALREAGQPDAADAVERAARLYFVGKRTKGYYIGKRIKDDTNPGRFFLRYSKSKDWNDEYHCHLHYESTRGGFINFDQHVCKLKTDTMRSRIYSFADRALADPAKILHLIEDDKWRRRFERAAS